MDEPNNPPDNWQHEQERPDGEGRPPRPATEPPGSEPSTRTPKTDTDPATGEPSGGRRRVP